MISMKVKMNRMSKDRIERFTKEAIHLKETKRLINQLQSEHQTDDIFEVKGYNLTLLYENKGNVDIEALFIYFDKESVIEVSKKQNTSSIEKVAAHFSSGHGSHKMIKRLEIRNGEDLKQIELPYKESYFDFFGTGNENQITSQEWWEGCLVFGDPGSGFYYYRHCGADCGDNGSVGGGTPINDLDNCCRAHDRCYAVFGYDDCGCDQELGQCAETTTDPGWYMVGAWAYEKDCV